MFFAFYSALTLPFPRFEQPTRPPLDVARSPRGPHIAPLRFHRVQTRT